MGLNIENNFHGLEKLNLEYQAKIASTKDDKDEIKLEVAGRNCPPIVNSQHDRRFK